MLLFSTIYTLIKQVPILLVISMFTGLATVVLYLLPVFSISQFIPNNFRLYKSFRLYLLSISLFLFSILGYWIIDIRFLDLPDPILPYIIYILFIAMNFNYKVAILTSIFTFVIVIFFLYEPRHHSHLIDFALSIPLSLTGLIITIILGSQYRLHQYKLVKQTEDLQLLIKARDQFTSTLVHDFKNPLTTIQLFSQTLNKKYKNRKASEKLLSAIGTIEYETDKLLKMVNTLLDFSKLQNNNYSLNLEFLDLVKICQAQIELICHQYSEHKFTFTSESKTIQIVADRIALERILTNLLSNAAKYSPLKSKVRLGVKRTKTAAVIEIGDQGSGINVNIRKHIFEPFLQGSNKKEGLGLGLYITSHLVNLHKGKISFKSAVGKGTVFTINLPIKPSSAVKTKSVSRSLHFT